MHHLGYSYPPFSVTKLFNLLTIWQLQTEHPNIPFTQLLPKFPTNTSSFIHFPLSPLAHRWVWSPAGGWWYGNPPHWKRNTVIWTGVLWLSMYGFVKYAEPRTTLYCPKTREVEFGKADARYVPKTEDEKRESARLEAWVFSAAEIIICIRIYLSNEW